MNIVLQATGNETHKAPSKTNHTLLTPVFEMQTFPLLSASAPVLILPSPVLLLPNLPRAAPGRFVCSWRVAALLLDNEHSCAE